MDPLELAWAQFLADPDKAGAFAGLALTAVEAELPADRYDPDLASAAAVEAVYNLIRHPERFDPARGKLFPYLLMSARGDLKNAQKKEARHHHKRDHRDVVELDAPARNEEYEEPPAIADGPQLRAVVDRLSAGDRAVFDLWLTGERGTAAFARVLGITDLPEGEWAAVVKQAKDRIKARIRRAGDGR